MRTGSLFALHEPILAISADCWAEMCSEQRKTKKMEEKKTPKKATLRVSSYVSEDADTTLGDTQGSKPWHGIPTLISSV